MFEKLDYYRQQVGKKDEVKVSKEEMDKVLEELAELGATEIDGNNNFVDFRFGDTTFGIASVDFTDSFKVIGGKPVVVNYLELSHIVVERDGKSLTIVCDE